jgi:hypothetical protein
MRHNSERPNLLQGGISKRTTCNAFSFGSRWLEGIFEALKPSFEGIPASRRALDVTNHASVLGPFSTREYLNHQKAAPPIFFPHGGQHASFYRGWSAFLPRNSHDFRPVGSIDVEASMHGSRSRLYSGIWHTWGNQVETIRVVGDKVLRR